MTEDTTPRGLDRRSLLRLAAAAGAVASAGSLVGASPARAEAALSLAGKRIGISRGFVIQDELDYAIRSRLVIAEEVGSIEQNLRKLLAGRIDA